MPEQLNLFVGKGIENKSATPAKPQSTDEIQIETQTLPVHYKRNARARHYLIYVRRDGTLRVTIPKYGNLADAFRFIQEKKTWIQRQWNKINAPGWQPRTWHPGTQVWLEGSQIPLETRHRSGQTWIQLGPLEFPTRSSCEDLRPIVEEQLRKHAKRILSLRTQELAHQHHLNPTAITIRSQSTRWGSCSQAGRISLNWRLIQVPLNVRDYVILHELMHMKELNHSKNFWKLVSDACPNYKQYNLWLRTHAVKLGM